MAHRVLVHPLIDLLGGHAGLDALSDVIEHTHVHLRAALDAFDILARFEQSASRHLAPLLIEMLELLIDSQMALLILLAAAAPACVVALGLALSVIHSHESIPLAMPAGSMHRHAIAPGATIIIRTPL